MNNHVTPLLYEWVSSVLQRVAFDPINKGDGGTPDRFWAART